MNPEIQTVCHNNPPDDFFAMARPACSIAPMASSETVAGAGGAGQAARPLKLAMVLFRYFPWGGMQANFLRLARECVARGHEVEVFTLDWQGERPAGIRVHIVGVSARRNHVRYRQFAERTREMARKQAFDLVVGFNRMPGLDIYYAADPCYVERVRRTRPWYHSLTARYRHFREFERLLFGPESHAVILALSTRQIEEYVRHYGTPRERFRLLPPAVPDACRRGADAPRLRREFRERRRIDEKERVLLMIGSDFKRKGFDRGLRAVASLPPALRERCRVVVVGRGRERPLRRLAGRLGMAHRLDIVPGSGEIPLFLQGADLLLHPARSENTGNVIVEAIAAGLPVLCSGACGYAFHVEGAGAGRVLDEPFRQAAMGRALMDMLAAPPEEVDKWRRSAIGYANCEDLYGRIDRAVGEIEGLAGETRSG